MASDPTSGATHASKYRRIRSTDQPENHFSQYVPNQEIAVIPEFELESGVVLQNVNVAYRAYGRLSPERDNAMVICHALTGSSQVDDWWGPMLYPPADPNDPSKDDPNAEVRAFDQGRFFVICFNSLGSPYGSASPVTAKGGVPGSEPYGPEFPLTTIKDDVKIFRLVLDDLGVKQIAAVIGGSMGGMLVLEFAYFGKDYVKSIIPIATSARYSAWGISWGEAQRQSIYSDPKYDDGYYPFDDPPSTGLGAARMSALLTYRSRDSFESRFGRNTPDPLRRQNINGSFRPATPGNEHFSIHNEGHRNAGSPRLRDGSTPDMTSSIESLSEISSPVITVTDPQFSGAQRLERKLSGKKRANTYFSAQSYLRYQGEKFIKRFDANCYIAITRKLDTHDVSRSRVDLSYEGDSVHKALSMIEQPTLILGIQSDGLFTFAEQQELAACIPNSELKTIDSPEGHDAFLLEFSQVNNFIVEFLKRELPEIIAREPWDWKAAEKEQFAFSGNSTFGEAEDITAW
ncbi:homoserine O-acetyltransferase [Polychaeton citri CBS 116435]|uniref:Homoserine O-acetyltransferase n=1 Tax=Polychaeton citri CBS 116435 TaxID=1314669 RepID=A0A9P4Q6Y7_9PEZI|nr:homoserine O-acetyltransferase [Polychaeton citri CBS 116435]